MIGFDAILVTNPNPKLPLSQKQIPILIDSDGGVDDALALAFASFLGDVVVPQITAVFGNVPMQQAARNLAAVRALSGFSEPAVAQGAAVAVDGTDKNATHVHGDDGLSGATQFVKDDMVPHFAEESAEEQLLRYVSDESEGRAILGIGPATNIGKALVKCRSEDLRKVQVTLMTGAYWVPGNITLHAEFNAHCDPEALQMVLESGCNPVLIGLDVTSQVILPREFLSKLESADSGSLHHVLKVALEGYMGFYREWADIEGCYPHDAIALASIVWPEIFEFEEECVALVLEGEERGKTVLDDRGFPARIATRVDEAAFLAKLESNLVENQY